MALITTTLLLQRYEGLKSDATRLRIHLSGSISQLAAEPASSAVLLQLYSNLGQWRDQLNAIAAIPGLTALAQEEEANPGYDIVAEIGIVVSAITGAITWIDANFPAANGYILFAEISGGTVTYRNFTSTQTAPLRTLLQSVVDAIGA